MGEGDFIERTKDVLKNALRSWQQPARLYDECFLFFSLFPWLYWERRIFFYDGVIDRESTIVKN